MNRKHFENRNSGLQREELDRKWRALLAEQEQLQWLLEQGFINQQMQQQRNVVAANNTFGGSGGGGVQASDESGLVFFLDDVSSTWKYFFLDFINGRILDTVDTGLDDTYNNYGNYVVTQKGYSYQLSQGGSNSHTFFFNSRGDLINEIITDASLSQNYNANFCVFFNANENIWLLFDGETLKDISSIFEGQTSYSFGGLSDGANSQGMFMKITTPVEEGVYVQKVYLVNSISDPLLITEQIKVTGESSENYNISILGDERGSAFFTILTDETYYLSITCYDLTGNSLGSIALPVSTYTSISYTTYGANGNLLAVLYSASLSDNYRIVMYNGEFESFTHDREDYESFVISSNGINNWTNYPISEDCMITFFTEVELADSWKLVASCETMYFSGSNPGTAITTQFLAPGNPNQCYISTEAIYVGENFIILPIIPFDSTVHLYKIIFDDYFTVDLNYLLASYPYLYLNTQGRVVRYHAQYGSSGIAFSSVDAITYDSLEYETDFWIVNNSGSVTLNRRDYTSWYLSCELNNGEFMLISDGIGNRRTPIGYTDSAISQPSLLLDTGSDGPFWINDYGDGSNDNIDDGGWDVYDGANYISINDSVNLPYTHTQMTIPSGYSQYDEAQLSWFIMDGAVASGASYSMGASSSYFTNAYPGLFVFVADNVSSISSFSIEGNIGADGNGSVQTGVYNTTGLSGSSYTCFVKTVCNSEDPTIHHMTIFNTDGTGINWDYDEQTNNDHDFFSGTESVTQVHYLLITMGRGTTDIDFESILTSYISMVDGKNINQMLSTLNSSYQTITDILPLRTNTGYIRLFTNEGVGSRIPINTIINYYNYNDKYLLASSSNIDREGLMDLILIDMPSGDVLQTILTDFPGDMNNAIRIIGNRTGFRIDDNSNHTYYLVTRDSFQIRTFNSYNYSDIYNDYTYWND